MNSPVIGNSSMVGVYGLATSLLIAAKEHEVRLPEEEKALRKERRQLESKERLRQSLILQSICPSCKGKLVRGKKNKKNDYKRDWKCSNCNNIHSI